jgi:acyl-CoA thioesterase FadM
MMVSKNNRFTTSFQVPSWDCGPLGRMFPVAMLRYFQESAVRHSDAEAGIFDRVLEHGLFWVMAGIRMNLGVLPLRGEKVSVTTWHAGGSRLLFYRGYTARGEDGRTLAAGVSSWALVNIETRRMVRASALPVELPESELGPAHEALIPERLGKMDGLENGISWCL